VCISLTYFAAEILATGYLMGNHRAEPRATFLSDFLVKGPPSVLERGFGATQNQQEVTPSLAR
jgi:hypothetical protein